MPHARREDSPWQSTCWSRCPQPRERVRDYPERWDGRCPGRRPTDPAGLARIRVHHLLAGTPVALETGTTSFYVARELALIARLDLALVVIDAHAVRLKANRPQQKSERRDALELCEGVRRRYYRAVVYVPSPEISALRTTRSRRRHLSGFRRPR